MKRIYPILITFILLSACTQPKKIAFVNNGDLINEYQGKLDIEDTYKIKNDAFTKKTDSIAKAFQLEYQQTQIEIKKSSKKKAQELTNTINQKQQILQQQIQFEQQQLSQAFQTEIDSSIIEVVDFVEDYGKKNGYDFIFGTSDASRSVMYAGEASDLTKVILEALNANYKKQETATKSE